MLHYSPHIGSCRDLCVKTARALALRLLACACRKVQLHNISATIFIDMLVVPAYYSGQAHLQTESDKLLSQLQSFFYCIIHGLPRPACIWLNTRCHYLLMLSPGLPMSFPHLKYNDACESVFDPDVTTCLRGSTPPLQSFKSLIDLHETFFDQIN